MDKKRNQRYAIFFHIKGEIIGMHALNNSISDFVCMLLGVSYRGDKHVYYLNTIPVQLGQLAWFLSNHQPLN